jgi:vacuolar-type H+-ATPase subunit H
MATLSTEIYLYRYQSQYSEKPHLIVLTSESRDDKFIFLEKQTITAEARDDDYIAERVERLRAKKAAIYVEAEQEVREVESKIQQLLCIEAPRQSTPSDDDIPF